MWEFFPHAKKSKWQVFVPAKVVFNPYFLILVQLEMRMRRLVWAFAGRTISLLRPIWQKRNKKHFNFDNYGCLESKWYKWLKWNIGLIQLVVIFTMMSKIAAILKQNSTWNQNLSYYIFFW